MAYIYTSWQFSEFYTSVDNQPGYNVQHIDQIVHVLKRKEFHESIIKRNRFHDLMAAVLNQPNKQPRCFGEYCSMDDFERTVVGTTLKYVLVFASTINCVRPPFE